MIAEEVEVEQAEVVMALRALSDDVQGHIERIGRMINEDLPAIADQLSAEFGAQQAQSIKLEAESALDALLVANKGSKEQMDAVIGQLTGVESPMMSEPMDPGLGAEEPTDASLIMFQRRTEEELGEHRRSTEVT